MFGLFKRKSEPEPKADAANDNAPRTDSVKFEDIGFGKEGVDPRLEAVPEAPSLSDRDIVELLRGDDLAANIVEFPVDEAMRQGFSIKVKEEGQAAQRLKEQVEDEWGRLKLLDKVRDWGVFGRGYGGAGLFVGLRDGRQEEPVNENARQRVDILQVFERRELLPDRWYDDPLQPKFGEPESYLLSAQRNAASAQMRVHESRIVKLKGVIVSTTPQSQNHGWGDSVLLRAWDAIRDYNLAAHASAMLIRDFSQAVFQIENLHQLIAENRWDAVKKRLEAMAYARSAMNAVVMDTSESFDRVQTPVSGLPEMLDRQMQRVASAAGRSVTSLFGRSPAGLSATGESDTRHDYDLVQSVREKSIIPAIERVTELIIGSLTRSPPEWEIEAPPLWQPSEKERAETYEIKSRADERYMEWGAADPDEVAQARAAEEDTLFPPVDMGQRRRREGD